MYTVNSAKDNKLKNSQNKGRGLKFSTTKVRHWFNYLISDEFYPYGEGDNKLMQGDGPGVEPDSLGLGRKVQGKAFSRNFSSVSCLIIQIYNQA